MAFTKATFDYLDSGGLINWITTAKTSAFTAVSGEGYLVDTSSAAVTVTLPTSPSAGDEIIIVDYASNAGTNNITLDPGTLNLRGATDDFVMSTNNQSVRLLYSGATKGWLVTSDAGAGAAAAANVDFSVDYLVVAGGGGAGYSTHPGAGAGGLRTSYTNSSSLAGHNESTLVLTTGISYTLEVGAGGSGGVSGTNGENSIFSNITSIGGGGGFDSNLGRYRDGGSGSGGNYGSDNSGSAVTSPVVHGHDGGTSGANYTSSGGGGAGAAGQASTTSYSGNGGAGLAVNIISTTNAGTASVGEISGSDVYFAGGGGGGADAFRSDPAGSGGIGGGGDGGYNVVGGDGTANTGGGGGGGSNGTTTNGGSGGSGVVILRYSSDRTITVGSGITEASGSPFIEGSNKVSVFTGGSGTISFS